jgi:hypothetical protein
MTQRVKFDAVRGSDGLSIHVENPTIQSCEPTRGFVDLLLKHWYLGQLCGLVVVFKHSY